MIFCRKRERSLGLKPFSSFPLCVMTYLNSLLDQALKACVP